MKKKLNEMTTADLLYIESVGGIISEGIIPKPLNESSTLEQWLESMPFVDKALIEVYFKIAASRLKLTEIINKFSN